MKRTDSEKTSMGNWVAGFILKGISDGAPSSDSLSTSLDDCGERGKDKT
jgi:hypothetical protein